MLPLCRKNVPSSKLELAQSLEESLRQFLQKDGQIVDVYARVFPYIDEIAVNLDRAQLGSQLPKRPQLVGETAQAYEAALVTVSALQASVRGVPLTVRVEAHDVVFHKGQDENGDVVLLMRSARDGNLVISAAQLDLENAIGQIAQRESRGITVEQVRLAIRARGPRSRHPECTLCAARPAARAHQCTGAEYGAR